jgi:hypothetical protein
MRRYQLPCLLMGEVLRNNLGFLKGRAIEGDGLLKVPCFPAGEHSETAVYRDGDGNVDVERAAELITLVLALDCRGAQDAQAPCNRSLITDGHMPLRRRRHIATLVELLAQL